MTETTQKATLQAYYGRLSEQIAALDMAAVEKACAMIEDVYLSHRKLFVVGNGWSHATASHFCADMVKTIFGKDPYHMMEQHPFDVECLGDNVPTLTATANDLPNGFDHIFALPLMAKAKKDDLLLVITGSGNSANIVKALEVARQKEMQTIGFLWFDGGKSLSMVDHAIVIRSQDYGVIEDMHSTLMHAITDYFKRKIWFTAMTGETLTKTVSVEHATQ